MALPKQKRCSVVDLTGFQHAGRTIRDNDTCLAKRQAPRGVDTSSAHAIAFPTSTQDGVALKASLEEVETINQPFKRVLECAFL